jgi:hypothetical protein
VSRCAGTEDRRDGLIAMREINIKLWRDNDRGDWSMLINGRFHEHVADDGLSDLVEGALIVAAKSLIQASANARILPGY